MLSAVDGGALTGRLLVATPQIGDPNFHRTVVLILAHGEEGAFGVVLNRPSDRAAVELVPAWGDRASAPAVMFLGGPVAPSAVVAVAVCEEEADHEGRQPVRGRLATLDLNRPPEEVGAGITGLRLFAGSAGWSPGQVESELSASGWWVVDAEESDAVDQNPEGLWAAVLSRQPGELRWYARYPVDASVN